MPLSCISEGIENWDDELFRCDSSGGAGEGAFGEGAFPFFLLFFDISTASDDGKIRTNTKTKVVLTHQRFVQRCDEGQRWHDVEDVVDGGVNEWL